MLKEYQDVMAYYKSVYSKTASAGRGEKLRERNKPAEENLVSLAQNYC